jgi:hypothetical protein
MVASLVVNVCFFAHDCSCYNNQQRVLVSAERVVRVEGRCLLNLRCGKRIRCKPIDAGKTPDFNYYEDHCFQIILEGVVL